MEETKDNYFIDFNIIRNSVAFEKDSYFEMYLKDIYNDLYSRDESKNKGVSKMIFSHYFKIPIFISEKLFLSFDKDCDGYLNEIELTEGFYKLFLGNFTETALAVFNIFDYDNDGVINKGDVKVLMSYLPLKLLDMEIEMGYKLQMKSLSELDEILNSTFGNKENSLNFENFLNVIQKKKSDIYIHLLCFLYQNKPFQIETINNYKKHKIKKVASTNSVSSINSNHSNSSNSSNRLNRSLTIKGSISPEKSNRNINPKLPSPCKKTNFAPTEKYLEKFILTLREDSDSPSNSSSPERRQCSTLSPEKNAVLIKNEKIKHKRKESDLARKEMIRFTNQKIIKNEKGEDEDKDLNLENLLKKTQNLYDSPSVFLKTGKNFNSRNLNLEENLINLEKNVDGNEVVYYEQVVYKYDERLGIIDNKNKKSVSAIKKYYMVLRGREISIFSSNQMDDLVMFHNLSGCFVKENASITIDKVKYFSFSIIFSKNVTKIFYTLQDSSKWVNLIKKAIGYHHFNDYYDLISDIDEGRFGKVKLGVHKETGERVAVKIIKKTELTEKEMELVRTELDVTKLFRHPNIVRLLDHFENDEYIYMVMEYLNGGHLKSYLDEQNNWIPEKKIARIIYAIAQTIKYMNSFGIIHRDIKPENIMFTEKGDNSGIKVIDFGLTKTLAPEEKLAEGMGTITFVAPEVLRRKPYNKQIDVWSIGILLYLTLTGELPFFDENEDIIAKKIVFSDISFCEDKFNNRSAESVKLTEACLEKNPDKRITIENLLKNDWIKSNIK